MLNPELALPANSKFSCRFHSYFTEKIGIILEVSLDILREVLKNFLRESDLKLREIGIY